MRDSSYDYNRPFDIMVGAWTGHSILYNARGEYQVSGPSVVWIRWIKTGKVLRYFQEDLTSLDDLAILHEADRDSFRDTMKTRAFDLRIDGKRCDSFDNAQLSSNIEVEGSESRPGTYIFHLNFPPMPAKDGAPATPGGDYYNNQYFTNPNERQIIGPFIAKDPQGKPQKQVTSVVAQTFTRISYDIPQKFLEIEAYHIEKREALD
ncbi:MAG: hypothetical protein OIF47_09035 [Marinibacterium sp.]|nr:hypothetical protein [Marinibacterium sp.]